MSTIHTSALKPRDEEDADDGAPGNARGLAGTCSFDKVLHAARSLPPSWLGVTRKAALGAVVVEAYTATVSIRAR
jgi:hypothetical protein